MDTLCGRHYATSHDQIIIIPSFQTTHLRECDILRTIISYCVILTLKTLNYPIDTMGCRIGHSSVIVSLDPNPLIDQWYRNDTDYFTLLTQALAKKRFTKITIQGVKGKDVKRWCVVLLANANSFAELRFMYLVDRTLHDVFSTLCESNVMFGLERMTFQWCFAGGDGGGWMTYLSHFIVHRCRLKHLDLFGSIAPSAVLVDAVIGCSCDVDYKLSEFRFNHDGYRGNRSGGLSHMLNKVLSEGELETLWFASSGVTVWTLNLIQDSLRRNSSLVRLYAQSDAHFNGWDDVYAIFESVVFDRTSLNRIYHSNHTLNDVNYPVISRAYLYKAMKINGMKVSSNVKIRHKILLDDHNLIQWIDEKCGVPLNDQEHDTWLYYWSGKLILWLTSHNDCVRTKALTHLYKFMVAGGGRLYLIKSSVQERAVR
jgi:hypothetical protein